MTHLPSVRQAIIKANPDIRLELLPPRLLRGAKNVADRYACRPIHLADVLLALPNDGITSFWVSNQGVLRHYGDEPDHIIRQASWNLRVGLDDQEPATIEFLHDLLC